MMSPGTLPVAWEMRRILCCKIRGGKRAGGPTGLVVAFATEVNLARGLGVGGCNLGVGSWGLVVEVWGLGFGVWGLGFGVWGLEFGVWGLGFSPCRRDACPCQLQRTESTKCEQRAADGGKTCCIPSPSSLSRCPCTCGTCPPPSPSRLRRCSRGIWPVKVWANGCTHGLAWSELRGAHNCVQLLRHFRFTF